MSDVASIGHNKAPIVIPTEQEMLDEMNRKFPKVDTDLKEYEAKLAEFPAELSLNRPDEAEALQDLLGHMKKTQRVWAKVDAPGEKGPLNKLVKVVTNFFAKADERMDKMLEVWEPRYQAFLDKKKVEAERKMEEEAEAQRAAAEAARVAREKAEQEAAAAQTRAEEKRREEQAAREAAAKAEEERQASLARAEAAKAEEKRLADEKRERDKAEKEENAIGIRELKTNLKDVERLHTLAEADEASDEEARLLDALVKPGGIIGAICSNLLSSTLLDDEQRSYVEGVRTRLVEIRDAGNARQNKREQAKRAKAAAEAEAAEAKRVEERRIAREAENKRMADAKALREREEAAAEAAKEEKRLAEQAARDARGSAREAEKGGKALSKDAKRHGSDEDRAENRAERVETRLENSTDATLSQTRGDLGTVGGLTRRWAYTITDEAALRAVCGPLGEHLTTTALEGACFHWMRAHQGVWTGKERVTDPSLPGVTFSYEQEIRIA